MVRITEEQIKKIRNVLIDEGQRNSLKYGFSLGETIKFNPTQVEEILTRRINELANEVGRMKFRLKYTDDSCDVYEWMNKNETDRMTILHWKDRNIINFEYLSFVLRDERMFEPMQNESNDWIKHSCKYGHWERQPFDYDAGTLEFALTLLQKQKRK